MTRVNVIVEGPSEESFIKNVVAPALWTERVYVTPFVLGVPGHKGGNVNYGRVKKDILLLLKQDRQCYCSTMIDLYGLGQGFPGSPALANSQGVSKAQLIEHAIHADIVATIPDLRPDVRFFPYIQVHEFEALLFSETVLFASALGAGNLAEPFKAVRDSVPTPEDINEGPGTAPSKRVLQLYPSYKKVIEGTLAAQTIGLTNMRQQCPHFANWINWFESIAQNS